MENASRALIMAGSILIALIIISALLLMFNNLNNYQKTNVQNEREAQIIEFNNQYETYNRTDLRGSDIVSLLNRAVNYNTRKSSAGVGKEGEEIAFQPIKINVDLVDIKNFTDQDGMNNLIKNRTYSVDDLKNTFEEKVLKTIRGFENTYGQTTLATLAANTTKIFIEDTINDINNDTSLSISEKNEKIKSEKEQVEKYYREITRQSKTYNQIKSMKADVYKYDEYIQFKRAHFDCRGAIEGSSGVKYDSNTGRIIEMNFRFNGTIE